MHFSCLPFARDGWFVMLGSLESTCALRKAFREAKGTRPRPFPSRFEVCHVFLASTIAESSVTLPKARGAKGPAAFLELTKSGEGYVEMDPFRRVPQIVPFHRSFFAWEGSPAKMDGLQKKYGYPYSSLSTGGPSGGKT